MYYQEKIIMGELCFRTDPDGMWFKFTNKELTRRIQELEAQIKQLRQE